MLKIIKIVVLSLIIATLVFALVRLERHELQAQLMCTAMACENLPCCNYCIHAGWDTDTGAEAIALITAEKLPMFTTNGCGRLILPSPNYRIEAFGYTSGWNFYIIWWTAKTEP